MKKLCIPFVFVLLVLFSVSAFGDWYLEADWYQHEFELRPGDDFSEKSSGGWYYLGYDTQGHWELGVSYFEWANEMEINQWFSYKLTAYPTVFYMTYKFYSDKSPEWEPLAGVGYGSANVVFQQVDKTGSGLYNYMESHRYDVFAWTIGVRYYFSKDIAACLRYVRHEVDIPEGIVLGTGYHFGIVYRF